MDDWHEGVASSTSRRATPAVRPRDARADGPPGARVPRPAEDSVCPLLGGDGCAVRAGARHRVQARSRPGSAPRDPPSLPAARPEDVPIRVLVSAADAERYEDLLRDVEVWPTNPTSPISTGSPPGSRQPIGWVATMLHDGATGCRPLLAPAWSRRPLGACQRSSMRPSAAHPPPAAPRSTPPAAVLAPSAASSGCFPPRRRRPGAVTRLGAGEMWTCNSIISWVLTRAGVDPGAIAFRHGHRHQDGARASSWPDDASVPHLGTAA